MSVTVGRVNFTATIDGRGTPKQAENVGRQMGASASEGFDKTWSKGFQDTLTEQGKVAFRRWDAQGRKDGTAYGVALNSLLGRFLHDAQRNLDSLQLDSNFLDDFSEQFDDAGIAAGTLQRQFVALNDEGRISKDVFDMARRRVDDWAESQRTAAIAANDNADSIDKQNRVMTAFDKSLSNSAGSMDRFNDTVRGSGDDIDGWSLRLSRASDSADKNAESNDKMNMSWSKIPHNGRQAILITAAIISAVEQLATLSSAAGAGLLTVGAAAGQSVIGLGAFIAVFQGLSGEIAELPEQVRPAAEAFQALKDPLKELQDSLQITALSDAASDFALIGEAVENLIPAFQPLGDVIGNTIGKFADWAADASKEGGNLFRLVEASAPTFEGVLDVVGQLGDTLITAFGDPAMQKSIEGLVGWLGDLAQSFEDFVNSDGFSTWVENSIAIFDQFGGLLGGLAEMLNDLVTPEAVERTLAMIAALERSLPFFESLFSAAGELDVFGLIAELFGQLGPALAPFLDVLDPVARIINDVLIGAFEQLALIIELLAPILIPAQIAFEVLAEIIERLMGWFHEVVVALEPVREEFQAVTDQIIEAFNPAIEAIGDAVDAMLPSPEEFAAFISDILIPALQDVARWIETDLVPAIELMVQWIQDEAIPAIEDWADWFNTELGPMIEDVSRWLDENGDDIMAWAGVISTALGIILNPIGWAIDAFNDLFGAANQANSAASAAAGGGGGRVVAMASGGILTGPTHVLAGEAGREAFVPLDRPLDQVDPSVRWLAAIARGQGTATMASGGVVGGGSQTMFEAGSIVVQGDRDPAATAIAVLNRAAEMLV